MILIGTSGTRKSGVEIEITTTVRMTWNRHLRSILYDAGIDISTASMSFENRFIIRPTGVDSKNLEFIYFNKIVLKIA